MIRSVPVVLASTLLAAAPVHAADPDGVRAIAAEAIADAQSRSSLLLATNNAGHDGKFFVASEDGRFRLDLSGQIQLRYLAAFRDDEGGVDDFVGGFQTRRSKITFSGHVFDESLRFKISNEFNRSSGNDRVSDAYIEKRFEDGVRLRVGQMKLPFLREFLDSSSRQLAVDRSLVSNIFSLGRTQGVQLSHHADRWIAEFAYSDGARSNDIDFGADPTDWSVTGRAEWLAAGSFKAFRSQAGAIDAEPSLRFGGAVHAEERGESPGDAGGQIIAWTFDAAAAGPGWSASASYVGRESDQAAGGTFNDSGITAQFGVWATEEILPFVRWELLIPDGDRPGDSDTNVITAGANWYLHGEALKLTVDGVWLVDDAGSNDLIGTITGVGVLSPGTGNEEFVLRVQVQLLF